MATTAVSSAAKWLGNMLVEEAKYLKGVEEKVEQLQDELEWMQCFLRDIDAKRDSDARMHRWIRQITSLAYEAEDIIESFVVKVDSYRHGGLMSKLKRYSCIMREAKDLHEVGLGIDGLKLKISTLTSRLHTYGVKITEEGNGTKARREQQLRKSYAHYVQDEKDIVGLDKDVKVVVNQLLKDEAGESRTVALCGMGGLGKTTLAKKVYHHADVKNHFQAFAWACISQQYQVRSVLKELYRGLTSIEVGKEVSDDSLMEKLHEVQQKKKCLVVLDDIWKEESWDLLKNAFPVGQENSPGGKLLLTTRNQSVARYLDNDAFIHPLRTMNEEKARLLLEKKLGRDPSCIFGEEHRDEVEKLAKEMLDRCGGLPMAIVALGGVLAAKNSLDEWRITHQKIEKALLLSGAKDGGLSSQQVLELSYHDLPRYLKPCFLYLAVFPEDAEIDAERLISLWIAEGFITARCPDDYYDDTELQQERSLEGVGRRYLAELVDRSLVQIGSVRETTGKINTCHVHDLVRELCLSKAAKENFLKMVVGPEDPFTGLTTMMPSTSVAANTRRTYRRLAVNGKIYTLTPSDGMKFVGCISNSKSKGAPHVKSLLLVPTRQTDGVDMANCVVIMRNVFKEFRFIRVLDIGGFYMEALPKEVGDLVYLRHLSIRRCGVRTVPSSIRNLLFLQTLDLRSESGATIPGVIWRMKQLKRLYLPAESYDMSGEWITRLELGCKVHRVGLNNLEILDGLQQLYMLKYIPQLSNLRELNVQVKLDREELKHIRKIQSVLHGRLEHLSIKLDWDVFVEEVDALRDSSTHLRNELKLSVDNMHLPLPDGSVWSHHKFPHNLTSLYLQRATFEDVDPMQILENLPKLRKLEFLTCSVRKNMTCSKAGFPELASLRLEGIKGLEEWIIEEGAMKSLRSLIIDDCDDLKMIPDGIKHIHSLQYLGIQCMPDSFCDRVRVRRGMEEGVEVDKDRDGQARLEEGPDAHKVQHIPCIIFRVVEEIEESSTGSPHSNPRCGSCMYQSLFVPTPRE